MRALPFRKTRNRKGGEKGEQYQPAKMHTQVRVRPGNYLAV